MKRSIRPLSVGLLSGLLLLSSCHRDAEPLDRLSHAYTSFLDSYFDTEVASLVPLVGDNPNYPYWERLGAALNLATTSALRVRAASECIAAYDGTVVPMMDRLFEANDKLDKAVSELIESANAIHDQEWRAEALAIAKSAREAQVSFTSVHQLAGKRFGLQITLMKGLVANGGDMVALFRSSGKRESDEVVQISKDIDDRRAALATAKQSVRDEFSALKGKTGLREYQTKEAIEEAKGKSQ